MSKQTTLLQTWGYSGNENVFEDGDDEDMESILVEALDQSTLRPSRDPPIADKKESIGFDLDAGRTWIYPINYPLRSYQLSISETCLFQNTLVSLPTGLGKTFIAAVVMYNFYRWYPEGVIVFLAPTKPLVAQQIHACFNIMGIPAKDVAEMTGNNPVNSRKKDWSSKRVFFLTPQVLSNDLSRGLLPTSSIKCVVIDEAHRARGEYAYCQVIKELRMSGEYFRVIALSATPGNDIKSVQSVLMNLGISKIELRSEDSPDIVPYTFKRNIDKVVVPLSAEMEDIKDKYSALLEIFVGRLHRFGVIGQNKKEIKVSSVSKFMLLQCRNEFRQNPPTKYVNDRGGQGKVEYNFASCISLFHAYELLHQHDIMGYLQNKFDGDSSNPILNSSRPNLSQKLSQRKDSKDFTSGHPKINKLLEIVLKHFREKGDALSRVMIFSQYRDSVKEITASLHSHKPMVRAIEFIGQAGTKVKKGLTQKEQIEVIKRFREGGYNTLVSTCVGEEGLDIGEVDLIICFDVSKSPIQLIQRMGRTGRKRSGRIVVLVTKGKEEIAYNQCLYSKKSINRAILEKHQLANFFQKSPRMIPHDIHPKCHKMEMVISTLENPSSTAKEPKAKTRKSTRETSTTKKSRSKRVVSTHKDSNSINIDPFETTEIIKPKENMNTENESQRPLQKLISSYSMYSSILDSVDSDENESEAIEMKSLPPPSPSLNVSERVNSPFVANIPECEALSEVSSCKKNVSIVEVESGSDHFETIKSEFDDLYSEESNLDIKRFQLELFNEEEEEGEDYSILEMAKFNSDDILEEYEKIKNEFTQNNVSKMRPSLIQNENNFGIQTSTPRNKSSTILSKNTLTSLYSSPPGSTKAQAPHFSVSPHNNKSKSGKVDENLGLFPNFDMEFDHEDFFEEIDFDLSNKSTPRKDTSKSQKSLYSATQLTSFVSKNMAACSNTSSPKSKNSPKIKSSLRKETLQKGFSMSQANFEIELNSDEDMFADSILYNEEILNISKKEPPQNNNKSIDSPSNVRLNSSFALSQSSLNLSRSGGKKSRVSFFDESEHFLPPSKKSLSYRDSSNLNSDNSGRDSDDSVVVVYDDSQKMQKSMSDNKSVSSARHSSDRSSYLTQNSPIVSMKKRKKSAFESDSDGESDFIISKDKSHNQPGLKKRSSTKNKRNSFINKEVEVEDSDASPDEFGNESQFPDLDCYDASFVDDATQNHQGTTDTFEMYLHSSKEQGGRTGMFKMPSKPLAPITADIYSQLPNQDSEDEYENDSFCVDDDDDLEYSDSKDNGDNTMALIVDSKSSNVFKKSKKSRIRRPADDDSETSEEELKEDKVLVSPPLCTSLPKLKKGSDKEERILVNSHVKDSKKSRILCPIDDPQSSEEDTVLVSSPLSKVFSNIKKDADKECILVNSSEFQSCHELISNLKYTFKRQVCVRSFEGAGFIISPRLAVDRISYSNFLSGAQRQKIIKRCQLMNDLYERSYIILELEEDVKAFNQRTKYADMILCQISQSNIRLLYSKNQKTSAELISNLLSKESNKGLSFKSLLLQKGSIFNDEDFKIVSFFKSVPGIGVGTGYLLSSNYSTVSSFATSAVSTLMRKGHLEKDKASQVQDFLRKTFNPSS
ncbi:DEAD-box ATP-dependent RNA helicase FANCM,ATP-dependent DNA helicase MPH1,Fanconi anemia group M protein,Fanconi anemia group M protein homolog,ATP-dependent DNA helicase fml1,ATP-dependent DNA helicase mph1 [Lepeophtheirus salmonis]|uniref:Fanconi anemia group M protein n=1 Tax=Lepeophtheirus salmonis TaxID=72036 RepID=A0A7R8CPU6_LEPSM|nr:DEAD-box ATP-dependent RNA helicase FANCM,ATP-dependent DNA helicase MPH1,Fanconi anemia group M protein,Fanconi anemia group M protein homolog,ATP-dependent DNA helicase fml1,ATP-dependent DNA helicase mph1 [Lepeophtheirus salmonis]CAF2886621.1 DEAD-box ATP-dependent RNA helicase FANCM,ATP-dependent DNA helicase MPH1,Fanconi anemia group M protein,Fanconi anemia group M protein homolog,ATP-dependent DNA helicase fml1,ATP-dependent DNA helicase mph1 [Lepeophtheirus salmonis]